MKEIRVIRGVITPQYRIIKPIFLIVRSCLLLMSRNSTDFYINFICIISII